MAWACDQTATSLNSKWGDPLNSEKVGTNVGYLSNCFEVWTQIAIEKPADCKKQFLATITPSSCLVV